MSFGFSSLGLQHDPESWPLLPASHHPGGTSTSGTRPQASQSPQACPQRGPGPGRHAQDAAPVLGTSGRKLAGARPAIRTGTGGFTRRKLTVQLQTRVTQAPHCLLPGFHPCLSLPAPPPPQERETRGQTASPTGAELAEAEPGRGRAHGVSATATGCPVPAGGAG